MGCALTVGEICLADRGGKRLALVIGNSVYKYADPLRNPANDAKAIGAALTRLGFSNTNPRLNLDHNSLRRALQDFAKDADSADMAVIYFAGHGIEVNSRNFLIPTDAKLERSKDVEFETASLDQVLSSVDGARRLRLIILDACRNNPFRARMLRSGGARSIGQGLRSIEPGGNVLVAYAAKHGTFALDGKGDNSPFAAALRDHIEKPGMEIGQLFREVRDDVLERTGNEQEPYIYGTLGRNLIYLTPPAEPSQTSTGSHPANTEPNISNTWKPSFFADINRRLSSWTMISLLGVGGLLVVAGGVLLLHSQTREEARLSTVETTPEQQSSPDTVPEGSPLMPQSKITGEPKQPVPQVTSQPIHLRPQPLSPNRGNVPLTGAELVGLHPKDSFKECDDCPEMVVVPAGEFLMGSPPYEIGRSDDEDDNPGAGGQQVKVTIPQPFAVGKFEVTFGEWKACVAGGGCRDHIPRDGEGWGGFDKGRRPVVRVTQRDAVAYVAWLNRSTVRRESYRLLSEAEWEYAARAGTTTAFATGHTISNKEGHFGGPPQFKAPSITTEVGTFPANGFGLHDMHGNASELVADCYHASYQNMPQFVKDTGAAWVDDACAYKTWYASTSTLKYIYDVVRGGSFDNNELSDLRSAKRGSFDRFAYINSSRTWMTSLYGMEIGFRVARALDVAVKK